jgi:hypothetical protein
MLFALMLASVPPVALVFYLGYRTGLLTRIEIAPNTTATSQKVTR